jgi:hypothetical protein
VIHKQQQEVEDKEQEEQQQAWDKSGPVLSREMERRREVLSTSGDGNISSSNCASVYSYAFRLHPVCCSIFLS